MARRVSAETEGVEAHSAIHPGLQPPQPEEEHLERPRYVPRGFPGEFAPWEAWIDTATGEFCSRPDPPPREESG